MSLLLLMAALQDGGLVIHELGVGLRARDVPPNIQRDPKATGPLYLGRVDAWVPFEFDAENRGPSVDGVLTVTPLADAGDAGLTYRIRLALPQGSRKRVTFPVLAKGGIGFRVEYVDDEEGIVSLDGKRARILEDTKMIAPTAALALVATTHQGFRSARFTPGAAGHRYVVPIEPEALPDHALEYSGVDLLVLDDLQIDELSTSQQEAIVEYVARGGTLVVATNRNTAGLAGSRIEPLMPGTPAAVQNVDRIPSLEAAAGVECRTESPVAVTTFLLRDDAVAWGPDGAMAHRPHGRGTVIACGFPLSADFFQKWEGSRLLMDGLMISVRDPIVADPGSYGESAIRDDVAEALKDSLVKPIPEFGRVLWTMAGYALIVTLLPYAVFAKLRRLEWAWGAIVALAGGGALTVYGLGREFARPNDVVARVGIVEGGDAAGPHLRHNFYAFYATSGGTRDVAFASPAAAPYVLGGKIGLRGTERRQEMTIAYDGARLRGLETFTQDSVLFEATDRTELAGAARLRVADDGTVSFEPGGLAVSRAWVVFEGNVWLVNPPSVDRPGTALADFVRVEAASPDRVAARCVPAVLAEAARASERRGKPILVFRYDGGRTLADASIEELGLDFAFVEFDAWSPAKTRLGWRVHRVTPSTEDSYYDEAFYGEGVEYLMRLDGLGSAKLERTTLTVNGGPVEIEVYDWVRSEWHAVDKRLYLSTSSEVHVTPHGVGLARLRAKASDRRFGGAVHIEATADVKR